MRVNHGRADIGVPKQRLNRANTVEPEAVPELPPLNPFCLAQSYVLHYVLIYWNKENFPEFLSNSNITENIPVNQWLGYRK